MRWSFPLGRISGVPIQAHWLFGVLLIWAGYASWDHPSQNFVANVSAAINAVGSLVLVFLCVLLHELGHTVQAQALGIPVRRIWLLPFGGLAELAHLPENPRDEARVALAGPAVNLGLALMLGALLALGGLAVYGTPANFLERLNTETALAPLNILFYLASINFSLMLFNLLPAFPLDGGRALRGLLALRVSRLKATRIIYWLGWFYGGTLLMVSGWWIVRAQWLMALSLIGCGLFLILSAHWELQAERNRAALNEIAARHAVRQPTWTLAPTDQITPALAFTFKLQATLPVMVGERIIGVLSRQDFKAALPRASTLTVAHVMRTHFPYVRADETLWRAHQLLLGSEVGALPVLEGETLRGMLTLTDVYAARFATPSTILIENPIYLPGGTSVL